MTYRIKRIATLLLAFFLLTNAYSQYATMGTGNLKDKIWWFDWNGFFIANGASRTFNTTDGLTVTITFSNVEQYVPVPYRMNTWPGAILHLLYNFTDPAIKPALLSDGTWLDTKFSMTVTATRNGTPTNFNFVAADAEASNLGEAMVLKTTGSSWTTVDFYRNSFQTTNPLIGCNTQTATIKDTYGDADQTGQNSIISTKSPGNGSLSIDVTFEKGGTYGGIAMAFGIFAPIDRGDLPASYGFAYHQLLFDSHNECNYMPPFPSISQNKSLKIGNIPGDADGIQTLDDGSDEDGITSFPYFTTDGTYSITLPLENTTGANAFLTGWFDYDQSGTFTTNESITAIISNNATEVTLKWTGLPAILPTTGNFAFRFRLSSDATAVQSATGYAKDGEVEDYFVRITEPPIAAFTAPDTVCVNSPVAIVNESGLALKYNWNFCVADIETAPTGVNLGNPGNNLARPVFIDYAFDNGAYYGFMVNNSPGGLVKLDFGNSLLNIPTSTNLGNFGGIISNSSQGIQLVENKGEWTAIIVGGDPNDGTASRIIKLEFGTHLNNIPTATNWGNIGSLNYPHDLYVFNDNAEWYGLTVNYNDNTITRFEFGSDFSNLPTGVNLGNLGTLNKPSGICPINDNGTWRFFVANYGNSTLSRIDFGASLLSAPTAALNLGNPGGLLNNPRDLYIFNYCSQITGFGINGGNNNLLRFDFASLATAPEITSLGNIDDLNTPHSISKLTRVGSDLIGFVQNAFYDTFSRIIFSGSCTSPNVSTSNQPSPSPVTYSQPGTYNINLMVDEGLPTQNSFCKQIVVLPEPEITPIADVSVCPGYEILLDAEATNVTSYSWSPASGLSAADILKPLASPSLTTLYTLTVSNGFCSAKEDVKVTVLKDQDCVPPLSAFIIPDTVCVNSPVTLTNTSTGATSYYWNFCVADPNTPPTGENLGNIGNKLSLPVFMDYVKVNNSYYGFTINHEPGSLIRLDFGNSLLNTPTATSLGNFGGVIPPGKGTEGIQIVNNEGKWYIIIVGGYAPTGSTPRIVKFDFGTDITNISPIATNWGNIGNMLQPMDLHVFKEADNWYGLTISAENNTITRFNFTNSFDNTPTAVNLGNTGNLSYPTGIYAINDNGNWRVFITNGGNGTRLNGPFSLTRLDFGSSLLNTPVGVNLGNPGNVLQHPRDLTIFKSCGYIIGFAVNGHINNRAVVKLDFNNDLSVPPTTTSLGNIGNLGFPHSISKIFRVNEDLYSFVTNVDNNTITRLRFAGCTNASIPNSSEQNPAPITYNIPGTYNINLTINEGLPTQASFCRQVVVLGEPVIDPFPDISICPGNAVDLEVTAANATEYKWLPETGLSASDILNPVASPSATTTYTITATNTACPAASDEIEIKVLTPEECIPPMAAFTAPDTVCLNSPVTITNTSTGVNNSYFWNFCVGNTDKAPTGFNLGSLGNTLNTPVFMDYVESNGNYYGFVVNHSNGDLVRLDFGNSLLNTPVSHMLGNFGGITPKGSEGIQVISDDGKWYALIIGGSLSIASGPRIVRVAFGPDITNANPVATNWGNIGGLTFPVDLHVFKNGDDWHGFTVNSENNTITRFDFGSSFENIPTGVNMGNIGNLNYPTGIFAIQKSGNWHVFITNSVTGGGNNTNSSLTRLDFGNSLLNPSPSGVNLGNLGNKLISPRDLYITQFCDNITGFIVNQSSANSIVKLDFNGDLLSTPVASDIGNIGGLNFPHSISKIFRVGSDLYSFITNVNNNTLTRLRFEGCSNASIPNTTDKNPPEIIYNTPGTYNINLTINDGLPSQASFCKQVVVLPKPIVDFSFEQELCNPASVSFKNESENFIQFEWNMGNGTTLNNIPEPLVVYDQWGDYLIKLKATAEEGCSDSVTKKVPVRLLLENVITNSDTTFCWSGSPYKLNTLPGLKYCWTPTTGLSNPSIANPVIKSPIPSTTYHVNTMTVGKNLVVNGDFSAGNMGFTSDYNYSTQKLLLGEYLIDLTPEKGNIAFAKCHDHTSGDGNMMVMDGASIPNVKVWSQTIAITPNTNYAFSCWIQSIYWQNPAKLQFYINGVLIGDIFNASGTTCDWRQFYSIWNAGDTGQAEIAIVNQNTFSNGNDFALDDISFAELKMVYDSVTVAINANPVIDFSYDIPYCKSPQFTGMATIAPAPVGAWDWDFGDGVAYESQVLTHTYDKGGEYEVRLIATDLNSCKDTTTKTIQLDTIKAVVSPDTMVCANSSFTLQGSGGTIYEWSPAQFLSDPGLPDPEAAVPKTTRFYLTVKNGIGCEDTDSVLVKIKPHPFFIKPPDRSVCMDSSLQLAGGNGDLHQYLWSPAELLDDPTAMNPVTVPPASMQYRVTVTESPCGYDTSFNVNVTVYPNPLAVAWKQRDIDCLNPTVYLGASSSPGDIRFEWSPASGVDNPFSTTPLASADSTTAFVVKTTNEFGCSAYDEVIVKVTNTAKPEFMLANAFSPNGDGVNDCFGIKRWGNVTIHEFSIFNRWGEKVFSTENPRDCWNGMYKGKPASSGTFVYTIRATSFCGEMVKKGTVQLIR